MTKRRDLTGQTFSHLTVIELDEEKTKYILNKSIDIYSPVISVIIGNKYVVSVSRVIYE